LSILDCPFVYGLSILDCPFVYGLSILIAPSFFSIVYSYRPVYDPHIRVLVHMGR
jgi:hypothetical protein